MQLAAVALLLVGLLNGAGFYLRRVGLLETATYRAELRQFCAPPGPGLWLPARCRAAKVLSRQPLRLRFIPSGRLHEHRGPYRLLKLAKLVLLLAVAAEGLRRSIHRRRHRSASPTLSSTISSTISSTVGPATGLLLLGPALPLLFSTALSLLLSAAAVPWPQALASLVPSAWLLLLPLGGWLSGRRALALLALAVAVLLALQLPLLIVEAMRGLPMSFGPWRQHTVPLAFGLPSRLVGSFVHPNSLGAAVLCGLGFCLSHLRRRRWLPWLFATGLLLVLAARSASGLLGLPLLLLLWLRPPRPLAIGLSCLALGLLPLVPWLLGRPDVFDSLVGRVALLMPLLDPAQPLHLLFGRGLAAYSHQLASWLGQSQTLLVSSSDGMPALLLLQGGLLALVSFYGLLLWAWRVDPISRPFLLAILFTSLTLNSTELTPFALLLGLTLNRALQRLRPSRLVSVAQVGTA